MAISEDLRREAAKQAEEASTDFLLHAVNMNLNTTPRSSADRQCFIDRFADKIDLGLESCENELMSRGVCLWLLPDEWLQPVTGRGSLL